MKKPGPILVVDDDPLNLDALREVLERDHHLVFATSGAGALAAVQKHRPALILLDIEMPGMDGYEVCARLKSDASTEAVSVMFITSRFDSRDEVRGFAVGAVDFITKPIHPAVVRARVESQLRLVKASQLDQSYRDAISMLGAVGHYNDVETGAHIWRMAGYARVIAEVAGWDEDSCALLEAAAPLHDTGKVGIPGSILRKPGKLDPEEWAVMLTHTRIGYDILSKSSAPVFELAAQVALHHHEAWDGSGYPAGLTGEDIPESARIVALADVFDALTTQRPYKEAWPVERAVAYIRERAGAQFEPRLVELFESALPRLLATKSQWDEREQAGG